MIRRPTLQTAFEFLTDQLEAQCRCLERRRALDQRGMRRLGLGYLGAQGVDRLAGVHYATLRGSQLLVGGSLLRLKSRDGRLGVGATRVECRQLFVRSPALGLDHFTLPLETLSVLVMRRALHLVSEQRLLLLMAFLLEFLEAFLGLPDREPQLRDLGVEHLHLVSLGFDPPLQLAELSLRREDTQTVLACSPADQCPPPEHVTLRAGDRSRRLQRRLRRSLERVGEPVPGQSRADSSGIGAAHSDDVRHRAHTGRGGRRRRSLDGSVCHQEPHPARTMSARRLETSLRISP